MSTVSMSDITRLGGQNYICNFLKATGLGDHECFKNTNPFHHQGPSHTMEPGHNKENNSKTGRKNPAMIANHKSANHLPKDKSNGRHDNEQMPHNEAHC